jgi:hypothetical protein
VCHASTITPRKNVVFAVESEPVDDHDQTREELISARVLSVEATHVRARVEAPSRMQTTMALTRGMESASVIWSMFHGP